MRDERGRPSPPPEARPPARPLAVWRLDRNKAWSFLIMSVGMAVIAVWQLLFGEAGRDSLLGGLMLLGVSLFMAFDMQRQLRLPEPLLILDEVGLHDARKPGEVIRWREIEEAEMKGRLLLRSLRLRLSDGRRAEIDLFMVKAKPQEILKRIIAEARRSETESEDR